jgi:hypothetical protein
VKWWNDRYYKYNGITVPSRCQEGDRGESQAHQDLESDL